MPRTTARRRKRQIDLLRTQFAQHKGLAFADVLSDERIEPLARKRRPKPYPHLTKPRKIAREHLAGRI